MLATEGNEAVAVRKVRNDPDIPQAGAEEQAGSLPAERFIDFHYSVSVRLEDSQSPCGDSTVEYKRVVIGNEKCKMRFMLKNIRTHQGLFLVHDIRRVAHQDVVFGGSFTAVQDDRRVVQDDRRAGKDVSLEKLRDQGACDGHLFRKILRRSHGQCSV